MLAVPQGTPKRFANRKNFYRLPHKWGGLLFALFDLLTRKRVYIFLQTYLVTYYIFLQLFLYIFLYRFLISTYCVHIVSFAPEFLLPYLYFKFVYLITPSPLQYYLFSTADHSAYNLYIVKQFSFSSSDKT